MLVSNGATPPPASCRPLFIRPAFAPTRLKLRPRDYSPPREPAQPGGQPPAIISRDPGSALPGLPGARSVLACREPQCSFTPTHGCSRSPAKTTGEGVPKLERSRCPRTPPRPLATIDGSSAAVRCATASTLVPSTCRVRP